MTLDNTLSDKKITRILFVCLGNICRSPAAEAVMTQMVNEKGMARQFIIDSAGIGSWHVGELPDHRMRTHAARRGYVLDTRARQFLAHEDFHRFDYIVVMDDEIYQNVIRLAQNATERHKVLNMCDFFMCFKEMREVPDPYYGGGEGFELALDLIEDGCLGLIEWLSNQ